MLENHSARSALSKDCPVYQPERAGGQKHCQSPVIGAAKVTQAHIFSTPTSSTAPVQPRIKVPYQRAEANGSITHRCQSISTHICSYRSHQSPTQIFSTPPNTLCHVHTALRALMWSSRIDLFSSLYSNSNAGNESKRSEPAVAICTARGAAFLASLHLFCAAMVHIQMLFGEGPNTQGGHKTLQHSETKAKSGDVK